MAHLSRLLKLAGLACLIALCVLFLQFDAFAMQLAESWRPGTGWIAFLALLGVEAAGFVWLGLAWLPGRSKLVLKPDPTPEEREAFAREMLRRLRSNPVVKANGVSPDDPDFAAKAVAVLDGEADAVIRSDARKIFLGTALAQNGRLDAVIVFVALARMLWRISRVYNQRPTPPEMLSVYSTVSSTAFVAFSIDALDIPQTVTETMGSIVPAVGPSAAATSLPLVSNIMHFFTNSLLDGAANALLAIRAGVLAKNAFRCTTLEEPFSRSLSSKEVRATMLSLSQDCLGEVVSGLKDQLKGLAGSVADSCVERTKSAARSMTGTVSSAATSAGEMVLRGGGAVSDAADRAAERTRSSVGAAGEAIRKTVRSAGSLVGRVLPGRKGK